jgi:hypothetical protein
MTTLTADSACEAGRLNRTRDASLDSSVQVQGGRARAYRSGQPDWDDVEGLGGWRMGEVAGLQKPTTRSTSTTSGRWRHRTCPGVRSSASYRRGPGGAVSEAMIRYAIVLTGAAKCCWTAPRMIAMAHRQGSRASYDSRDLAAMFAGRAPVLEQLTRWARSVLSA